MTHLSPAEFVDLVDGTLAPARAAHAEACAECRTQAAVVQSMLREAGQVEVPEPSPLFWDHFSARVRGAVAEERLSAQRSGWFSWSSEVTRGMVPVAATAVLVVALLVGAVMTRRSARAPEAMAARTPAPAGAPLVPAADDAALDAANSEVWDVLTAAASDMQIEDAREAGMTVRPGAIDRAVQKMAPDELNELGRLLQSELKHSGA
jgi:hypothetical protein